MSGIESGIELARSAERTKYPGGSKTCLGRRIFGVW